MSSSAIDGLGPRGKGFLTVDELSYSINGGTALTSVALRQEPSKPASPREVNVALRAGNNTIPFFNDSEYVPDLDRITLE